MNARSRGQYMTTSGQQPSATTEGRIGYNGYINIRDPSQVASLNQNDYIPSKSLIFPRQLYNTDAESKVMWQAPFLCSVPRDVDYSFIYPNEKQELPDYSSRFAYARNPNGYGYGTPSIGYNEPLTCSAADEPANMAPDKYYPVNMQPKGSTVAGIYYSMCRSQYVKGPEPGW